MLDVLKFNKPFFLSRAGIPESMFEIQDFDSAFVFQIFRLLIGANCFKNSQLSHRFYLRSQHFLNYLLIPTCFLLKPVCDFKKETILKVVLFLHFSCSALQDGIRWHELIERRVNFCRSFENIIYVIMMRLVLVKVSFRVYSLQSHSQNIIELHWENNCSFSFI